MDATTWFVTGAARGFGREIAMCALRNGANVVATARDAAAVERAFATAPDPGGRLLPVALDLTDPASVTAAIAAAVDAFGDIDVLVNNAGRGLVGAVEETSEQEVAAVFDTNVFGTLRVTRQVLPLLRRRRSGHVVNIGSMGGFAQVAGWGIYGATKFALEGLTESMRAELEPLGVRVMIVEPGGFRTDFLSGDSLEQTAGRIADYDGTVGQLRTAIATNDGLQNNDPAKGADAIWTAVTSPNPPLRLQLGADAVQMVETKLASVADELTRWREVAESTAFEGATG